MSQTKKQYSPQFKAKVAFHLKSVSIYTTFDAITLPRSAGYSSLLALG